MNAQEIKELLGRYRFWDDSQDLPAIVGIVMQLCDTVGKCEQKIEELENRIEQINPTLS